MYSRYLHDDRGTYTRVSAESAPPPSPAGSRMSGGGAVPGERPLGKTPGGGAAPGGRPGGEQPGRERPSAPIGPPPRPVAEKCERPAETGVLNRMLEQLHLGDIDSGDLLLLFLLFFLFRQKADEELLIAIGLLLIL